MLIEISVGDEWLHDYPILGPISRPNPPTFAVWMTASADPLDFVGTVFVTAKMGNASWIRADDGRPEALPVWSLARGGQPTSSSPAPDGVTGATPVDDSAYVVSWDSPPAEVYVWLEINHSVDYTAAYPDGAGPGTSGYSGGPGGSGQPALIYCAGVDTTVPGASRTMQLTGHSEPGDIGVGTVYDDLAGIDSALRIINHATVQVGGNE